MANPIQKASSLINAMEIPHFFTEFVNGTFDSVKEQEKIKALSTKALRLFFASVVCGIASFVTVPWEISSKIRQGQFSLKGLGFIFPFLGLGAFALCYHYGKSGQNQDKVLLHFTTLSLSVTDNPTQNLELIRATAENHFNELKKIAQPDPAMTPKPGVLPLLIELHYLQSYCQTLAATSSVTLAERKISPYPWYNKYFKISPQYLEASEEKKMELQKKNIILVTGPRGKSFRVNEIYEELGLAIPKS
ncbi:MAG: hypothetical protein JSS10_05885 [Verrucomicrobia bacterium]|nr:hypothetical protein [Verrucomicrobiota bacterium]